MSERESEQERREYFPPKVVHTEKMTARAVVCMKADDASCSGGPIDS